MTQASSQQCTQQHTKIGSLSQQLWLQKALSWNELLGKPGLQRHSSHSSVPRQCLMQPVLLKHVANFDMLLSALRATCHATHQRSCSLQQTSASGREWHAKKQRRQVGSTDAVVAMHFLVVQTMQCTATSYPFRPTSPSTAFPATQLLLTQHMKNDNPHCLSTAATSFCSSTKDIQHPMSYFFDTAPCCAAKSLHVL